MEILLFSHLEATPEDISITELRDILHEQLAIASKKATQLARYLIEPYGQGEFIFNENLRAGID